VGMSGDRSSRQFAIVAETRRQVDRPKPFVWKKDPDAIIAAVNRGFQTLESIH
jgi:hypothetical protein